jgi:hypothetical protein
MRKEQYDDDTLSFLFLIGLCSVILLRIRSSYVKNHITDRPVMCINDWFFIAAEK